MREIEFMSVFKYHPVDCCCIKPNEVKSKRLVIAYAKLISEVSS